MKKICIITTISLTIEAFFLEQIAYLAENEYEVTIICDSDSALIAKLPKGVNYVPVKMKRGLDPISASGAIYRMYHVFRNTKFDIVQYSTPNAALYASIASKLAGIKIRLYHNMGYRYSASNGIRRIGLKRLERLTCKLSTEVQTVSFSNLDFGIREGLFSKSKAKVIWNGSTGGINLSIFDMKRKTEWKQEIDEKYQISSDEFVFGFVGRITKDKGINELLSAYQKLSFNNKKVRLMLVGNEENVASLDQTLYHWAKERKDIIFTGSTSEVYKYFAAFDVMVLPSYREGFGNVVIEAQAMKVPVIVTDIPGPIDAMERNVTGLVIPKQDEEALMQAMERMLEDKKLCATLGEKAYQFVKDKFDSQQLIQYIYEDKERLMMAVE